ncbi:MAG: pyridine nucleotide-disulfide oxidoreductase [Rhizobiales bacterium 17-65-6]|nr:MAG: pyridine nucleotide-disulfide oxidoreductase [Rhizobiales bacterium 12-68-15]OYX90494.1 MAG: pyridine nucleotide-disulfide oxidoreductase [Azorhizobium sp. 32-67-21]OYY13800.1 MAG: pyridine nucleotide-disulfide oxidoreductase [Rhizobiales bacterium 35-68-8]OYZ99404.1 MAG: pyridine nucleotide-disulfide oxidoreductase [Rhizobiales bacterium 17-65-6]
MEVSSRGMMTRRALLASVAGAASLIASGPVLSATKLATKARIVIAGAGAAGLSAASRLSQKLDGADIVLIDARKEHYYQPGFTLIAAGLQPKSYSISLTRDYLPAGVRLVEDSVAAFEPEQSRVRTAGGETIGYDFLIVATGLSLDYAAIEGMDTALIGRDGIGSVYAGPEAAEATGRLMAQFAETGGVGLFHRPATEMKCAGAPLKYTFLTDDRLRSTGMRDRSELIYAAQNKVLFSVPIVSEKVRMLFEDRGVKVRHDHVMTAIDPGRKIATFKTPSGPQQIGFDFVNVVPPMRAPQAVRASALAWQTGPFAADGWMEVDMHTLRHKRFANVFGVGDVAGVPKGKTAASVKWQVPVAVDHLVASLAGTTSTAHYNGYTSCPLITAVGRAMLVEFDYENNLTPSFPGVIAPLEELWVSWVMKKVALKPTYIAMLRGQA